MIQKFEFHTGRLNIDTSSVLNYDMKEIVQAIVLQHSALSFQIFGRETCGAIFVTLVPGYVNKITILGSFAGKEFSDEKLREPSEYLWIMIDQIDAAYRARFMTLESIKMLSKNDFIDTKQVAINNQKILDNATSNQQKTMVKKNSKALIIVLLMLAAICGAIIAAVV